MTKQNEMTQYFSFHNHSDNSHGDSIAKVKDLVKAFKEAGYKHACITDHGNTNAFAELWFECKKNNMIPVLGCEIYVCDNAPKIKEARDSKDASLARSLYRGNVRHCILIAKNKEGYRNLMNIIHDSVQNFYNKPITTTDYIAEHSEGIICSSACLGGIVGRSIGNKDIDDGISYAKRYKEIFGDDFYLELSLNDADANRTKVHNNIIVALSKELGIKTSIANDVHYISPKDYDARQKLMYLRSNLTMKSIETPTDNNREKIRIIGSMLKHLYFKKYDELKEYFLSDIQHGEFTLEEFDTAIENNKEIFDKIGDFCPNIMSSVPNPTEYGFDDLIEFAIEGLKRRGLQSKTRYVERMAHELKVIKKLNISSYLLVLYDFVTWTKERYGKTSMSAGRGSSAASLVLYCLGVTEVDPIQHNLLFSRFLDESKIESGAGPDVDLDFSTRVREHVLEYVSEKYPNTINIGTVQIYKWKSVIKDIFRFYDVNFAESNKLTKEVMDEYEKKDYEEIKEFMPKITAKMNELGVSDYDLNVIHGIIKSTGQHPAGVVLGDKKEHLSNNIPYFKYNDQIVSGWSGDSLGDLGFYKYDFLGLSNVEVVDDTLAFIRKYRKDIIISGKKATLPSFVVETMKDNPNVTAISDVDIDLYRDIDLSDTGNPEIYEYANESELGYNSVFQFGTNVAGQMLEKAKPKCFNDLVAMNSVLRPATIRYGMTDEFIKRMTGQKEYTVHPEVEEILGETYGIIIFQEQCMQLLAKLGGFSESETNKVRKLLIKKSDVTKANKFQEQFMNGAVEKIGKEQSASLWEEMVRMSEYAFCKAHAVSYTILATFDLWLKYYYGIEFYTAVLNNQGQGDLDKVRSTIQRIHNKQVYFHAGNKKLDYIISILPPDVNESELQFTINKEYKIRYGLSFIKSLTSADAEKLVRKTEKLKNHNEFLQFCINNKFNKSSVLALIYSGACDLFGVSRNQIFVDYMKYRAEKNLFNYSLIELVKLEAEYCGVNFDLLEEYGKVQSRHTIENLKEGDDGEYEICFTVNDIIIRKTKTDKKYVMVATDAVNLFVWNMAKFERDAVKKGETLKCYVTKKGEYIQYKGVSGRVDINGKLGHMKKYREVEILDIQQLQTIKQQELF